MNFKGGLSPIEDEELKAFISEKVKSTRKIMIGLIIVALLLSTMPFLPKLFMQVITGEGLIWWGAGMTLTLFALVTTTIMYTNTYNKAIQSFFEEVRQNHKSEEKEDV